MPMLYLNVRHTLPMIGMRVQRNTLDSSINQPRYEQETQTARSNRGVTQPKLTINSYPSRHSYGYTNNTDFARENYERGAEGYLKAYADGVGTCRGWPQAGTSGRH